MGHISTLAQTLPLMILKNKKYEGLSRGFLHVHKKKAPEPGVEKYLVKLFTKLNPAHGEV